MYQFLECPAHPSLGCARNRGVGRAPKPAAPRGAGAAPRERGRLGWPRSSVLVATRPSDGRKWGWFRVGQIPSAGCTPRVPRANPRTSAAPRAPRGRARACPHHLRRAATRARGQRMCAMVRKAEFVPCAPIP
eukprot:7022350-Pyramimonas_sp.AAC.1